MRNTPKRWNLEARMALEKELNSHGTLEEIAAAIGYGRSTTGEEIRRGGGRQGYSAIRAQELGDKKYATMILHMSESQQKVPRSFRMIPRIEALEMQVQILSETLKELVNVNRNK